MKTSSKQRAHTRVSAGGIVVTLGTKDGRSTRTERIANISLGGVFIEADEPLAFGDKISLEFAIPGSRTIRCGGMVMWNSRSRAAQGDYDGPSGMGVRLSDISVADMRALADFIASKLP